MTKPLFFILLLFSGLTSSAQKISQTESRLYFFKVWNYVKYYHPAIAGGDINADTLFLRNLPKADNVKTRKEFNSFIEYFLTQVPKTVHREAVQNTRKLLTRNKDNSWYSANKLFNADNKKKLSAVFSNRFTDSIHHYLPNLRYNEEIPNEPEYAVPAAENIPYPLRMLALAKMQGAVDYLFPHKYLMDQDFDSLLKAKLPLVAACKTRAEYETLLLELVSALDDTHAFKFINQVKNRVKIFHNSFFPPFKYAVFDDRIVVTEIMLPEICSKAGIEVGDAIFKVNNDDVSALVADRSKKLAVSNKPTLRFFLSDYIRNLIWKSDSKALNLTIRKNGIARVKTVDFIANTDVENIKKLSDYINGKLPERRSDKNIDILSGDIAYFKIREGVRFTEDVPDDKFDSTIDSLFTIAGRQKGMIFDMREYPDWGGFIAYMLKKFGKLPNRFADYYEINRKEIGTFVLNNDPNTYNNPDIIPNGAPYQGKVVIIVNPATLSQSEWNTMSLQHIFPQSITIGEQSAGADGDEKMMMLPGGYKMSFTGNALFYPDGTNAQRKGVHIDKFLPLTPENVLEKDYLLTEAVRLIKS